VGDFAPLANRDASQVIQGYVYQFQWTILRWLQLNDHETLELEKGEDIDLVTALVSTEGNERTRVLEQIKSITKSSVTLRTPSALGAIANSVLHRERNRSIRIAFVFTSSATAGGEKPLLTGLTKSGIQLWRELQASPCASKEDHRALRSLQKYLVNDAKRPTQYLESNWNKAKHALGQYDYEQLAAFVKTFNWNLGVPDARNLEATILDILGKQGHATEPDEAHRLYDRLLIFVLRKLIQTGSKSLSRSDLPKAIHSELAPEDASLLANLQDQLRKLANRVDAIEVQHDQFADKQQDMERRLDTLSSLGSGGLAGCTDQRISLLVQNTIASNVPSAATTRESISHGVAGHKGLVPYIDFATFLSPVPAGLPTASFDIRLAVQNTEAPPLVALRSERKNAVGTMLASIDGHLWTAIVGAAGSGKTQLANLTVRASGKRVVWIGLRDFDVEMAFLYLLHTLATLGGGHAANQPLIVHAACSSLGRGSIIVLDDLGRCAGSRLAELLIQLAHESATAGVHILSTSHYQLPGEVRTALAATQLGEEPCLKMSDEEAEELFRAYGAPVGKFSTAMAKLCNLTAQGHPQLLSSMGQYLRDRAWQYDSDTVSRIWKGEHSQGLASETIERILDTVSDIAARDLLYRLNIVIGSFSTEDAVALANAAPSLARPRELLNTVLGLWVQEETGFKLSVSPLVKSVGVDNVPPTTQRECRLLLGKRILERRVIHPLDGMQAIGYFAAAQDFDSATLVLLTGLRSLLLSERATDDWGLLLYWHSSPLPEALSLEKKLMVRSLQVAVGEKFKNDIAYVFSDLTHLIQVTPETQAVSLLAVVPALRAIMSRDKKLGWGILKRILSLISMESPGGILEQAPARDALGLALWLVVDSVNTLEDLHAWLDAAEALPPEELTQVLDSPEAASFGCRTVMELPWLDAHGHIGVDWASFLESYQHVKERAEQLKAPALAAFAVRTQIVIAAEEMADLEHAVQIGTTAISTGPGDPRVLFLIRECVGRQYYYGGKHAEAFAWLRDAIECDTDCYPEIRVEALIYAAISGASENHPESLTLGERAVALAESTTDFPKLQQAKVRAELALLYWRSSKKPETFRHWEKALGLLLESECNQDHWKERAVLFGHVGNHFAFVSRDGKPLYESGDTRGELPTSGRFFADAPKLLPLFDRRNLPAMTLQVSVFARQVGDKERASWWVAKTFQLARAMNQVFLWSAVARDALAAAIQRGDYETALEDAFTASKALRAIGLIRQQNPQAGIEAYRDADVDAVLSSDTDEGWNAVTDHTLGLGVIPSLVHIAFKAQESGIDLRSDAHRIAAACQKFAVKGSTSGAWASIANAIEASFERFDNTRFIEAEVESIRGKGWKPETVIFLLGYGLQDDAELRRVAAYQTPLYQWLTGSIGADALVYEEVVLPYVAAYWKRALEREKFRLSAPRLILENLARATALPPKNRTQAILACACSSLGIKVTGQVGEWLRT